ncbi:HSF-type DNA-binding-domain-containing protein, partial [Catenaria anguillulae PL171]
MLSPSGSNSQSFVHKLFKMVNDTTTDHIVRWTGSGESFIIDQVPEFEKLLPRYYKHSNLSSFIRQANMYGFHKVNKAPRTRETNVRDYEFANPNFKRGRPDLLDNIRRK